MTENNEMLLVTYTEITFRVPGSYTLNKKEFRDWYTEKYPWRGDPFDDWDADEVLEFIHSSPDIETEVLEGIPEVDPYKHDIMESNIVEVEFA